MSANQLRSYAIKATVTIVTAAAVCVGLFHFGLVSNAIPRSLLFGS